MDFRKFKRLEDIILNERIDSFQADSIVVQRYLDEESGNVYQVDRERKLYRRTKELHPFPPDWEKLPPNPIFDDLKSGEGLHF